MWKVSTLVALALVALTACAASPSQNYSNGDVLLTETFDQKEAWETYQDGAINFAVEDGVYRARAGDGGFIWGLNAQNHSNVVIEVTAQQLSTFEDNAYGVMCRADVSNDGDGYYFVVSGDGFYSIRRGEGDDVSEIVDWARSDAINKGTGTNTIRAVCDGDYLALYVNGTFLAEARDTTYTEGYAGIAVAAAPGGSVDISFDNLTIALPLLQAGS
jgi:hypothetical protein